MITIKNVSMRNFLSIGGVTQTVDLSSIGLTLVLGNNLDIGESNSRNGTGKSTLIQALSFALYGEALTTIRKDNLINNINSKGMMVTVDFERDGKNYRIERGRKPNILRFFVKDKVISYLLNEIVVESDEAQGENKQTQIEIERAIGMSHTLFKHLVALNTYTLPFLKLKPADQREVIEELLGMTQLSLRDEVLTKLITDTKRVIRDEEAKIGATTEANARISKAIDRAVAELNSWTIAQKVKIEAIASQINDISDIDFDGEIAIFDLIEQWIASDRDLKTSRTLYVNETESIAKEMRNLTLEIKRQRDSGVTNFQTQLARLRVEAKRCEGEAAKTPEAAVARLKADAARRIGAKEAALSKAFVAAQRYEEIQDELKNVDGHTCTTCGQGLSGTGHLEKIRENLAKKADAFYAESRRADADADALQKEADEILAEIDQVLKTHAAGQQEWLDKIETVRMDIEQVKADQAKQEQEIADKIADLEAEIAIIEQMLAERGDGLNEIDAALSLLGTKPSSSYRNREEIWKLRETKDKLLADLDREIDKNNPYEANVASLKSTLHVVDYAFLNDTQVTLKHQDFLHRLLSGKDSFVRKKIIDQNLLYLNIRMNNYLEALGLPHEVRFMPDLTVDISMLGHEFDFEQLSRGEQGRVILSTSWAFRDVWESSNTSLNLCIIDELLDNGVDQYGAEAAVEVLEKMARERGKNVFLISHKESLMGRVNHILMVHKENQFTRYESDAEIV